LSATTIALALGWISNICHQADTIAHGGQETFRNAGTRVRSLIERMVYSGEGKK
jgi:hypothetical protein